MEEYQRALTYAAHPDLIENRVQFMCGMLGKTHAEVCDSAAVRNGWTVGEQNGLPQRKLVLQDDITAQADEDVDQMLFISISPELKITEAALIEHIKDDIECLYEHPPVTQTKKYTIGKENITVEFDPSFGEMPVELGNSARGSRALHREYVGSIRATKTVQLGVSSVTEAFDYGPDKTKQTYFLDKNGKAPQ